MEGLTVGRVVHWVNDLGLNPTPKHMAAMVVHVWDSERGLVNLFVPPDSYNVQNSPLTPTSVQYADASENRPGTWHWIEKA